MRRVWIGCWDVHHEEWRNLLYVLIPRMYCDEEIILNPEINVIEMFGSETELFAQTLLQRQLVASYLTLTWATIFSVKICFLLFFRQLVDWMKELMLIWKIVFVITISVFCFCICGTFILCPHYGHNDACKSGSFASPIFSGHKKLINYSVHQWSEIRLRNSIDHQHSNFSLPNYSWHCHRPAQ